MDSSTSSPRSDSSRAPSPRTISSSPAARTRTTTMNDEIEQLLRNLHLRRMAEIFDDEVKHAEKQQLSYSAFLARLLRAQYHHRQETALAWRIKTAGLPEQGTLESFPFNRHPAVPQNQLRTPPHLAFIR